MKFGIGIYSGVNYANYYKKIIGFVLSLLLLATGPFALACHNQAEISGHEATHHHSHEDSSSHHEEKEEDCDTLSEDSIAGSKEVFIRPGLFMLMGKNEIEKQLNSKNLHLYTAVTII